MSAPRTSRRGAAEDPFAVRRRPVRELALALVLAVPLLLPLACTVHRQAGTGDVAFRLIWDGISDLDLLVAGPGRECIFFGHRRSTGGGVLDVDCNGASDRVCEHPVENVFWPPGSAPPGRYYFWVHAHALVPAEAPVGFTVEVLRGTAVAWEHRGQILRDQKLHGPFSYSFPDGKVTGPLPPAETPLGACPVRAGRVFLSAPGGQM